MLNFFDLLGPALFTCVTFCVGNIFIFGCVRHHLTQFLNCLYHLTFLPPLAFLSMMQCKSRLKSIHSYEARSVALLSCTAMPGTIALILASCPLIGERNSVLRVFPCRSYATAVVLDLSTAFNINPSRSCGQRYMILHTLACLGVLYILA